MTTHADLLLGADAMASADPVGEDALYAHVADLGVGGVRRSLPLQDAPGLEPSWIARNLCPAWDLPVTHIPTVMGHLGSEPACGLASADEHGRRTGKMPTGTSGALTPPVPEPTFRPESHPRASVTPRTRSGKH